MKKITEISNKKPTLLEYYSKILQNKYLIFQITKKEFITAYTQSLLGFLYHALVPLVQTIIFNFFIYQFQNMKSFFLHLAKNFQNMKCFILYFFINSAEILLLAIFAAKNPKIVIVTITINKLDT